MSRSLNICKIYFLHIFTGSLGSYFHVVVKDIDNKKSEMNINAKLSSDCGTDISQGKIITIEKFKVTAGNQIVLTGQNVRTHIIIL